MNLDIRNIPPLKNPLRSKGKRRGTWTMTLILAMVQTIRYRKKLGEVKLNMFNICFVISDFYLGPLSISSVWCFHPPEKVGLIGNHHAK